MPKTRKVLPPERTDSLKLDSINVLKNSNSIIYELSVRKCILIFHSQFKVVMLLQKHNANLRSRKVVCFYTALGHSIDNAGHTIVSDVCVSVTERQSGTVECINSSH